VCAVILVAYTEDAINNYSRIVSVGLLFFWGLSSALLIYVLDSLKPANIGGMRVFAGLGKVSFSLYLVHFPIFLWLSKFTNMWKISSVPELNFLLYLIVAFSVAYLLSLILYYFIEKPGVELGRVLIRRFL
jgi:peptidoglycan/LPS O-acetylase OafA/YrhL